MKKNMLKFNPELFASLEKKVRDYKYGAVKKKMFGHEVFFLNGYMFAGANESGIFVNVGKEARDRALEGEEGVIPFEPLEGTVMKDYLLLQEQVHSNKNRLKKWLDQSSGYLCSLPPRKK